MQHPQVKLKPRRAKPFYGMHPWVFAGAIDRVLGQPADGDVVDLVSHADHFVARGIYNSRSKIQVRLYSWNEEIALDAEFFRQRLASAVRLRRDVLNLTGARKACRLVFSEADGLSGIIVDQYDRWLVVQFNSLAMALRREMWQELLVENLHPEGIYVRNERGIGKLEGMDPLDGLLSGAVPHETIEIEEEGLVFAVNLTEGQKTGYFLDQRDNRQVVAKLARGRRFLDAFCYAGGFGLHAARAGASQVVCVDSSETALGIARVNAGRNGFSNFEFRQSDVFDQLDAFVANHEKFGVIVLDPPKFARTGSAIEEALRGYRRLISQSLKLLEPESILTMCCCSGVIPREAIHALLAQEAAALRRPMQILEDRGAAADHPVSVMCPESNYLKCIVTRVG